MRYFDFLVEQVKKAKQELEKLKQASVPTFMTEAEKHWRLSAAARYNTQLFEYESYGPSELKLLLMDAKQALIFSEKENPEDHWQEVIKPPFDVFFLELSEPIKIHAPEPDELEISGTTDYVHAICYRSLTAEEVNQYKLYNKSEDPLRSMEIEKDPWSVPSFEKKGIYPIGGSGSGGRCLSEKYELPSTIEDNEYAYITVLCVADNRYTEDHLMYLNPNSILLSDGVDPSFLEAIGAGFGSSIGDLGDNANPSQLTRKLRSFLYHVPTGTVKTRVDEVSDLFNDPSQIPENYPKQAFNAGEDLGIENRYLGWWEQVLLNYSSLTSWILLYLMAKGIEIVEEPLPRSEKRRKERESKKNEKEETTYPNDWHIIQSKPRFSNGSSNGNGSGKQHRFRYDVMGHLRHGRHQLKDGTWKLILEWVTPHQRGLNNSLYIPAIRKAEVNKKSDERNYEYFRKPGELP